MTYKLPICVEAEILLRVSSFTLNNRQFKNFNRFITYRPRMRRRLSKKGRVHYTLEWWVGET